MAASYRMAGSVGLVLLKIVLVATMLAILLWSLRDDRLPTVPRDFLTFLAVAATFSRIIPVRPQLFSLVLFCGLLALLKQSERQLRVRLLIQILLIAWVNLHGGWLVGLGTLLIWSMTRLMVPSAGAAERRWIVSGAVLAVLATLVNPYGTGLWAFLYDTVSFARPDINDWQPIFQLPLGFVVPWVLGLMTALFALARGGWPANPARAIVCLMLAVASTRVSRLDAFFGLSVVLLLAPQVARAWPRSAARRDQHVTKITRSPDAYDALASFRSAGREPAGAAGMGSGIGGPSRSCSRQMPRRALLLRPSPRPSGATSPAREYHRIHDIKKLR